MQRERSLAERLQKQLNDKAEQRDKMESLLKEHQENIAAQLVDSTNGIVEILNSKDYNQRFVAGPFLLSRCQMLSILGSMNA